MSFAKSILFCALLAFAANASAVTMNWSYVGNPGNPVDTSVMSFDGSTGYGSVPRNYFIGTYDVTYNQYTEFLNAKDPGGANLLGLLYTDMLSAPDGGINFNPHAAGGSKYSVQSGAGSHPVTYVSWYDTIRFANWMNNGQGSGDTETGAYTLGPLRANGLPLNPPATHNAGAHIWLPTENEWYKAAYYNPGTSSYFLYPTSSNTTPISSSPTALPNHANFAPGGTGFITNVGAYTGTTSPYGAFDMGGNVMQWNEALISGAHREFRGGSFFGAFSDTLRSSTLFFADPSLYQSVDVGFRLAMTPEPSTLALAAIGFIALAWRLRRHA